MKCTLPAELLLALDQQPLVFLQGTLALKCKHLVQQTIWGGISSSLALGLALLAVSLCSPGSIGSSSSPASAPYTTISPFDPTQSGGLSQCVGGIRE
ncbi:hypothetical protein DPX16_6547 [Anabarilius grahami]|uniref:Uncharacterized protein n=1 Tax=Anabarilius grahami TaxID=495550 RepID=A0A3N0XXZ1_ANAGA|nr:hypothetical protein DPX16_6547 [Anabarilius grahami]